MKIALLGYGKEGKAVEAYFRRKMGDRVQFKVFENLTNEEFLAKNYSSYDIIFRSPSVRPLGLEKESSVTKYFFEHCPCPIIGVTATKGKGTTCSFIKALLDAHGEDAYLVGNIGVPAIEVLDKLTPRSVVVYEMSSFQLWDLKKSPHVAVIGVLEPDHLNVHKDYEEYLGAKKNIMRYQGKGDYLVYNRENVQAVRAVWGTAAKRVGYPFKIAKKIQEAIKIPGKHNIDNATAAIAAVASYLNISPHEYIRECKIEIKEGLASFKGLPHRLEFVRELDGILYYDDNFATNAASMKVAVQAFPEDKLVVIAGGRDKTENEDLGEIYENLKLPNVYRAILIGESGREIFRRYEDRRFILAESLQEAVEVSRHEAEKIRDGEATRDAEGIRDGEGKNIGDTSDGEELEAIEAVRDVKKVKSAKKTSRVVVLMSPAAASFDMFKDVYDRGAQYQELVKGL